MKKTDKISDLMTDIYRDLYKNSTPPADFDELLISAKKDENGQLQIPYLDHEIEEELFNQILDEHIKKSGFTSWTKSAIRTGVLLGCSPKFKNPQDH